ncbi:MAG: hypothetical protein O3A31_13075 [Planctomycetota bacterium]|nr:hypothetical protein [Planctomycetota bacterium]
MNDHAPSLIASLIRGVLLALAACLVTTPAAAKDDPSLQTFATARLDALRSDLGAAQDLDVMVSASVHAGEGSLTAPPRRSSFAFSRPTETNPFRFSIHSWSGPGGGSDLVCDGTGLVVGDPLLRRYEMRPAPATPDDVLADAGILLLEVVVRKTSGRKTFLVCDGGMNALLRPSHYDAFHFAWPTTVPPSLVPTIRTERPELDGLEVVDLVGPICETGDFLARDRSFPPCDRGDLIAIFATGAYGMTMASRYNAMPLPAEVMVDGSDFRVVRRRETVEDLLTHER